MKSSTSFSLAAITFLSTMTSTYGVSCMDPSKHNPTTTPQCINVGTGGYTCQNVRLGGAEPDYQCVAPPPTPAPTADEGGKKCDPNIAGQCFTNGKYTGSDCKNVRIGGTPEYRCVAPAPTAAPTPEEIVSCMDPAKHNPTTTPQCINVGSGGYTCKNVRLGGEALYQCVPPGDTDDDDDYDYNDDDDDDDDDFEFLGGVFDQSNDEQAENAAINEANVVAVDTETASNNTAEENVLGAESVGPNVGALVDDSAAASDRALARLTLSSLVVATIAAIM